MKKRAELYHGHALRPTARDSYSVSMEGNLHFTIYDNDTGKSIQNKQKTIIEL